MMMLGKGGPIGSLHSVYDHRRKRWPVSQKRRLSIRYDIERGKLAETTNRFGLNDVNRGPKRYHGIVLTIRWFTASKRLNLNSVRAANSNGTCTTPAYPFGSERTPEASQAKTAAIYTEWSLRTPFYVCV